MELGPGALGFDEIEARHMHERFQEQVRELERSVQSKHEALSAREQTIDKRLIEERRALEAKEQALYEQMEHRSRMLEQREATFAKSQLDREQTLSKMRHDVEIARRDLSEQLEKKLDHLSTLISEAEHEKARYSAQSLEAIQKNSGKFVKSALETLGNKESRFHGISTTWAVIGALSLCVGVVFAILSMIYSADSFHQTNSSGLGYYLFHLFRGLVVIGVFAAISRYAFVFSNSYMHESLKAGERVHAIKFGEFYLDTYGASAEWEQVKEAFVHWNITGQSAFSKHDTGNYDALVASAAGKAVEKVIETVSAATKKSDPA